MTITLEWWWCLPLAVVLITFIIDIADGYSNLPWSLVGWPFAVGVLLGHFL